jgi:hypothetical protein
MYIFTPMRRLILSWDKNRIGHTVIPVCSGDRGRKISVWGLPGSYLKDKPKQNVRGVAQERGPEHDAILNEYSENLKENILS